MNSESQNLTGNLFIGIPIEEQARKNLKRKVWKWLEKLPKERPTASHNWHLTIAFIGKVEVSQMELIKSLLSKLSLGEPFSLNLKGLDAFPSIDSARVLWMGVEKGANRLATLAENIRETLKENGIPIDEKPFIPHLTLCRMRSFKPLGYLQESKSSKELVKSHVQKILLYESQGNKQPYLEHYCINLHQPSQ